MHKCWSLYNKEEKLRIDDLTKDQVRTILLAISAKKIKYWYACREGDLHWQGIADLPDFHDDAMAAKGESSFKSEESKVKDPKKPNGPPRRPLFEDGPTLAGTTIKIEAVQTKERRTARRYLRHLLFRVKFGGTVFECPTKDVSMGGISLTKDLPPIPQKTFRAELLWNDQAIKVLCSRVTDQSLKIIEADSWDLLRQWLVNW